MDEVGVMYHTYHNNLALEEADHSLLDNDLGFDDEVEVEVVDDTSS